MAALNRGVPHYADGTQDVPLTAAQQGSLARDAQNMPYGYAGRSRGDQPTPVPTTTTMPAAPPSGLSQLLTGQFTAAQQNPEASPATAALGQFADYLNRSTRVDAVGRGPSLKDRLGNLFFGNQASTAAIADHDAASQALRNPVVQQHLMNNPDQLAMAEKDRLGYVQRPEFKEMLQHAASVSTAAAASPKVTAEEHPQVVAKGTNAGVSADAAHASIAPQKYTEDEFIKTFSGIPTKTFALLFGSQLGHVRTPQEKAATEVLDRLHGNYAVSDNKVKMMEAQDAAAKEAGKPAIHSGYTMFGKNAYDMAKEERDKALTASMDALKALSGISQKPFQVPPAP